MAPVPGRERLDGGQGGGGGGAHGQTCPRAPRPHGPPNPGAWPDFRAIGPSEDSGLRAGAQAPSELLPERQGGSSPGTGGQAAQLRRHGHGLGPLKLQRAWWGLSSRVPLEPSLTAEHTQQANCEAF